jgi:hypothetical protein
MPHNIDNRGVERFLGTPEDKKVFEAVIVWMIDARIIRAKNVSTIMDGTVHLAAAQLTAKGLAIVKHPLPGGDTIEKRVQSRAGGNSSFWSSIGELVGGFAGGVTKSLSSG